MINDSTLHLSCLQHYNVDNLLYCTKNLAKVHQIEWVRKNFPDYFNLIADQISLAEKAENKLPLWFKQSCLFTLKSLEQCSSPATARYKADLLSYQQVLDLSGGLGVDDVAFCQQNTKKVVSLDPDETLNQIVEFNFLRLGIHQIQRITTTAEAYLNQSPHTFDLVYIDADRRSAANKKIILLHDSQPNVIALLPVIQTVSSKLMVKLSPIIDIEYLKRIFGRALCQIHIVGVKQEVKEVLVLLDFSTQTQAPLIKAVQLDEEGNVTNQFTETILPDSTITHPTEETEEYFYEASAILIKSGLTVHYAKSVKLTLFKGSLAYMTGGRLVEKYFGRSFKIIHHGNYSKRDFQSYLKTKGISKANVSMRNFPMTTDECKRKFKLIDGGDDYLFFYSTQSGEKFFWHVVKPNQDSV
jgi:hypothetical protein